MFDFDFGLAAAERQRENDLPHKKTLYQCYFCGGEIYEGETIHIIGHKVYCDDCHREDVAEREIEE